MRRGFRLIEKSGVVRWGRRGGFDWVETGKKEEEGGRRIWVMRGCEGEGKRGVAEVWRFAGVLGGVLVVTRASEKERGDGVAGSNLAEKTKRRPTEDGHFVMMGIPERRFGGIRREMRKRGR
ncbi:hypothetical protein HAX54_010442 [Datura stramonium]|uniref:Uncharacterized protein n=1 Tax=Datura stramonium TaxID=4076 RepID=A0ABS8TIX5_DATST|nr:hypothetical protein [Datura stramonium]